MEDLRHRPSPRPRPGTITSYLTGKSVPGVRRPAGPDPLANFVPYVVARFADDPHLWATALFDEVFALGYDRAYPSFARQVRLAGLRPSRRRPPEAVGPPRPSASLAVELGLGSPRGSQSAVARSLRRLERFALLRWVGEDLLVVPGAPAPGELGPAGPAPSPGAGPPRIAAGAAHRPPVLTTAPSLAWQEPRGGSRGALGGVGSRRAVRTLALPLADTDVLAGP